MWREGPYETVRRKTGDLSPKTLVATDPLQAAAPVTHHPLLFEFESAESHTHSMGF